MLGFLGDIERRFGGGSFIAICLRMLTLFSGGGRGGAEGFLEEDEGSSKCELLFLDLGFSGGNSGGQSGDGGLSCFFFKRPDDVGAGAPICIFHFPADAAASATACLAFCSLVGEGESNKECFGDSLKSLLLLSFSRA